MSDIKLSYSLDALGGLFIQSQNFTQLNDLELHDINGHGKSSASI